MKIKITVIAAAILAVASAAAYSHTGATGIVKERMDSMAAMGKVVKTLSLMMRGETEYNPSIVRQGAGIISLHSGDKILKLFEKGGNAKPSVARDEIWTNWTEFKELADRLTVLSKGLDAAADNGLMKGESSNSGMMGAGSSTMMGQGSMMGAGKSGMMGNIADMPSTEMLAGMPTDAVFNLVTQTCSSCHTKFRIEKK